MALKKHQRINWEEVKERYSLMDYELTKEENVELRKTITHLENRIADLEQAIKTMCKVTEQPAPRSCRTRLIADIIDDCPVVFL